MCGSFINGFLKMLLNFATSPQAPAFSLNGLCLVSQSGIVPSPSVLQVEKMLGSMVFHSAPNQHVAFQNVSV